MELKKQEPPDHKPLIILFIIITICVVFVGLWYYSSQKNALINEKQLELSAIADLKIRQISQWRLERIGDGSFLGENILMLEKFSDFFQNTSDVKLRTDIYQTLRSLVKNFDYKSVLVIDNGGNVKLSYPSQDTLIGDHLKPLLPEIIKKHKIVITDLHRASVANFVHLDLIVPIIDHRINDTATSGFIALRIDPEIVLFPLVQSWPTPSKSAETLLIRKENDEIVYLNELRHLKNSELMLRMPVTTNNLAAVMAINGITGTTDAVDYRGVPVVAAMNKVPGTTWYMVAKIDKSEILESLNGQMIMILIILLLIILTGGLFLGFLIRQRRERFYREKYEDEHERLVLVKHFDYILKFANDIILLLDSDLKIVEANDKALETYGFSREEFIGLHLENIRAPETIKLIPGQIRFVEENESATFETVHKRRDGSVFPVEISSRIVKIEESNYYQTIARNITERKLTEEVLKESEERFRKLFEESPFPMVMTGKDYHILKANLSFCRMTGYQEDELKSLTFRDFTHPEYIAKDELSLLRLVAREIPVYHTEKIYIRKDGSEILGSTTVSIIRNKDDEAQFFLAMVEDITSRKKAETELILAKEKAEESDRLKTAFLHNVSHEIRTPMNAIIGFSSLINEPDLTEAERTHYGDIILQSSNQLLSVINDIVDIANIESGQVKLNLREMNLNSSLKSLNEQFMLRSIEQKVPLYLKTGLKDEESDIKTDLTKLIQVLSNLLNNAFKFTRKGKIEFSYILKDGFIEFAVNDTGIGISAEHIEKIFNRFYQVDAAGSRRFGGTGLGLSICKAYVEFMGGIISVESEPGKGTNFTFTIPYVPA
jgi:PAS domain S-box-containing protein